MQTMNAMCQCRSQYTLHKFHVYTIIYVACKFIDTRERTIVHQLANDNNHDIEISITKVIWILLRERIII